MYLLYFEDIPNLVSCAFSTIPIFPPFNSQNFLFTCIYYRYTLVGMAVVTYLTDRVNTYRIVLNVSTRFYFSVYATILLEPRKSLLSLTPAPCRGHTPISVIVNSDNTKSTTDHSLCSTPAAFRLHQQPRYAFSTVNQLSTVPLCVVVYIPVHVGSLNVPCCASSRAIL